MMGVFLPGDAGDRVAVLLGKEIQSCGVDPVSTDSFD